MSGNNIIWIIVDSVRNYRCDAENVDDRGRIELMDELAKTWVDFKTVVTSAPSTMMSLGAMFTSCPAYYLGSNFVDLRLYDFNRHNIGSILRKNGYATCCITLGPYEREAFDGVLDILPRSFWPKGARHRYEWNNYQCNIALENLIKAGMKEPFFLLVHYNCRGDDFISENVDNGLNILAKDNILDRSIVFLTSDHGYPDPVRKQQIEKIRQQAGLIETEVAHDLVLTEDNILVPLLLKYPGVEPRTIEEQICTLDYLPTSLSLAGIPYPADDFFGMDVTPLIHGKKIPAIEQRSVRVDGRFLAQTGRITAIRRHDYKYVINHDDHVPDQEQLHDLKNDPLETRNFASDYPDLLEQFRKLFTEDEERCRAFHIEFFKDKYNNQLKRLTDDPKSIKRLGYIEAGIKNFDDIMETIFEKCHLDSVVIYKNRSEVEEMEDESLDLLIVGLSSKIGNRHLFKRVHKIKSNIKLIADLNMNLFKFTPLYPLAILRGHWIKRKYYLQEPLYLYSDLKATLRHRVGLPVKKHIFKQ